MNSTLIHLRIPFSIFLSPVFLLTLLSLDTIDPFRTLIMCVILHLFLYPASNGFNSYYDKDTESIGGVKNPPPVSRSLLWTALVFDAAAIILGALISRELALALFVYGLASKAYSWDKIRLKKRPIGALLVTSSFCGFFVSFMTTIGVSPFGLAAFFSPKMLSLAVLLSVYFFASYPMTQIYQHESDAKHGDTTISMKLGIRGTFVFVLIFFTAAIAGFAAYYAYFSGARRAIIFLLTQLIPAVYFIRWMILSFRNPAAANFDRTMRLNAASAGSLILFVAVESILSHLN
jgi:4-hydroxybenzoate polyprenyltransferase